MKKQEVLDILDQSLEYLDKLSDEEFMARHNAAVAEHKENVKMYGTEFASNIVEAAYKAEGVKTGECEFVDNNISSAA